MLLDELKNYHIYLASKSPRRRELLQGMGIEFEVISTDVPELYPQSLQPQEVVEYLSQLKLSTLQLEQYPTNSIFIACDTIVCLDGKILEKPKDRAEAFAMLRQLSDNEHIVYSGLTILSSNGMKTSHRSTKVKFRELADDEIAYYIDQYAPMDKAGAYGVQEWIGYIGIDYIDGSFYNVMGLPTKLLWEMLSQSVGNN